MQERLKPAVVADLELFVMLKGREYTAYQSFADRTNSTANRAAAAKKFAATKRESERVLKVLRDNLRSLREMMPPTKGEIERLAYAVSAALREAISKKGEARIDRKVSECVTRFYADYQANRKTEH